MRFLNSRGGGVGFVEFRRISWGILKFFHHHGGQGVQGARDEVRGANGGTRGARARARGARAGAREGQG